MCAVSNDGQTMLKKSPMTCGPLSVGRYSWIPYGKTEYDRSALDTVGAVVKRYSDREEQFVITIRDYLDGRTVSRGLEKLDA